MTQGEKESALLEIGNDFIKQARNISTASGESMFADINDDENLQFELFWVEDPLEYQYLAITRDQNRASNETIINGPYSGNEFLDKLESVLNEPRWQQPANHDTSRYDSATGTSIDASTRKSLIIDWLQSVQSDISDELYTPKQTKVKQFAIVSPNTWMVFIMGDIFQIDDSLGLFGVPLGDEDEERGEEDEEGGEEGEEDEEEDEEGGEEGEEDEEEDEEGGEEGEEDDDETKEVEIESYQDYIDLRSNGIGTYFFEPIWIDGIPDIDFQDRILINPPKQFETICNGEVGGHEVYFDKDGYVAVKEPESRDVALDILNTIFGVSVLLEREFEAATMNDLYDVEIGEEGEIKNRFGSAGIRRQHASPSTLAQKDRSIRSIKRRTIEKDYIENLCDMADDIYSNEDLRHRVLSTLQAFTHHVNDEYTQAFLLAWISIEQYINSELNEYLKEHKSVNSDRRRKMERGGHWGASHLLELMEISGCIDESRYSEITKLRKKRNRIVHDSESADESNSRQIVNLSFELIDEYIDNDEKTEFVT